MADGRFNIAGGRAVEFYNNVKSNDPAASGFIVVLLKVNETEADLIDHDTLALLIADAGNTEADFTNYARKVLTDTEIEALPAPDDTNNYRTLDLPDRTYTSAGGATNNTLTKAIICYAPDTAGADSTLIPISHQDFTLTTDGNDMVLKFHADGWYRT